MELNKSMGHAVKILSALLALALLGLVSPLQAEPTEKRIALVIGNSNYQVGALQTAANDAGLIAQTLQAAGFDVVGARDLDEDSLRHAFRDFVEKASGSGPDTVALVYFAGYGLQLEGENYLVPVDANIGRDSDVPSKSVRVSDYIKPLTALQLKARIVVLDAARIIPFSISGQPLAGGLSLVEPGPGMLVAFNAAPGTVAPAEKGPYGAYAQALAEMIREGGLSLGDLFDRVRLRVNEVTKGAQVPWHSSRIERSRAQTGARHHRCPARGNYLAPNLCRRHAECLLVISAAISAWSACRGCPAASGRACRRSGAAAGVRHDRLRRAAAIT